MCVDYTPGWKLMKPDSRLDTELFIIGLKGDKVSRGKQYNIIRPR